MAGSTPESKSGSAAEPGFAAGSDGACCQDPRRCPRCFLPRGLCLCALVPRVDNATPVLILQHRMERGKPSNSGRLAARALQRCDLLLWAVQREPLPAPDLDGAWLLFPGTPARPPGAPRRLVVVDGTWQQARRMTQRVPWLRGLPRFSLAPAPPPVARLRRGQRPDGMSTLEAIAHALAALDGPEVAPPLLTLYAELARRSRAAQGA